MTIDTKKEIEEILKNLQEVTWTKALVNETDEDIEKTIQAHTEKMMALFTQFAEKREKEEQAKIEELFQDTKSHFDYWLSPRDMDALWATFGQRIYKYFGLPIKEENK